MDSGNPALNKSTFNDFSAVKTAGNAMTAQGTVNKTILLSLILFVSAAFVWQRFFDLGLESSNVMVFVWGGAIAGFVIALLTIFVKASSPYTAPLYALVEGLFIGGVSALFEVSFPGIVIQATALTIFTLFAMLFAYKTGIIKVTEKFRLGVFAATGGIALVYLATLGLSFFGVSVPFVHDGGFYGIAFSLFVVVIAALNLAVDFDFIERGAQNGAPKYMEWYGAFALMVTLVWLYLEILRLISKTRR